MAQPRRNDFLIPTLGVLFDGIAIEFSFLFSYFLRFKTKLLSFLPLAEEIPPFNAYFYGSLVIILVWLLIFKAQGMYGARRNVPLADELFTIVKLVTLGMLVVMSAAFFYRAFSYSRIVFGLLWVTSIIAIFVGRYSLYHIEKGIYRRGRELRNAVIIGGNETAELICQKLYNHPLLGYRLVGYFADRTYRNTERATNDRAGLQQLSHLGTLENVSQKILSENVELALIALTYGEYPKLSELIRDCEGVNIEFMLVPDILEVMTSGVKVKEIEGIPFIRIKSLPMTTWGRIAKRLFDIILSTIFLIVLSPLFLFVAIAIKLESKGSVFFRQERIGIDGKKFEMWKFRSMRMSAEQETGPVWTKEDDTRRARVGTFLRKTSIDELPQLINVVKGEMSLVGPRPERPYFVEQFRNLVPKYLDRHRVKTGITGWAQVNGFRGNTSLQERIRYDIYYIENWSFWFDVKIVLKTLRALFSTKNVH